MHFDRHANESAPSSQPASPSASAAETLNADHALAVNDPHEYARRMAEQLGLNADGAAAFIEAFITQQCGGGIEDVW